MPNFTPTGPEGARIAPEAMVLARIAFSGEFDERTRMNAAAELARLRYDLAMLRRLVERETGGG